MRSFKDSVTKWNGLIPNEWEIKPTKFVFSSICTGATPKSGISDYWGGEIIWITPADYKTEDVYIYKGMKTITEQGYKSCSTTLVPKDSIVFSKRAPIGTVALAGVELCVNQGCLACVGKQLTSTKYFYYQMSVMTDVYNELGLGTTFMEISFNNFRSVKLLVPPLAEQRAIVSYLDARCTKIDEVIAKRKCVIEKLKEYKSAIITKAVTKGLNPDVEMRNHMVLGDIPVNCSVKRLKFVADIVRGGSPRPIEDYISETGYNWIKIGDAIKNSKYIMSTKQKIKPEGLIKTRFITKGTLILSNSMSFGQPYILGIDGCIHDGWLALSNYKGIAKEFLYYYLLSSVCLKQFCESTDGSVVQNLNINKVRNSLVVSFPIEEQQQIVDYLDSQCVKIDEAIAKQEQAVAKLEEYRKSVIYYAVTGKIDCRDILCAKQSVETM
jgi:type I restriction enzyme S subunit